MRFCFVEVMFLDMNWRSRVSEALVGGATGLFVVACYIVARARIDGADAGDWLAFAGVIFGVMLTAGVTVGIQKFGDWEKFQPLRKRALAEVDELRAATKWYIENKRPQTMSRKASDFRGRIEEISAMNWELSVALRAQMKRFTEAQSGMSGATIYDEKADWPRIALDCVDEMRRLLS
ncbi:hypothetical protein CG471_15980 [Sphingobium sp. IP1]|nr:hypothetical protein CG471_15980 [Sphingobium sp. IP1]